MADLQLSSESYKKITGKEMGSSSGIKSPEQKLNQVKAPEKKEPTKLSNWDEQIAPIIDDYPQLKSVLNYKNSKHIMRAVNGRYDKVMNQLKEEDPKAYESFKNFKNNSWALANELKKIDTGEFNPDSFSKYMKNATTYYNGLADSYQYDKNKKWAMNSEGVMMNRDQYEKWDQTPKVSKDKASTSARVVYNPDDMDELIADYETGNISKGYQKLKNIDKYYKDKGLELIQPITKSWVSTSLQNIGKDGTDADTNSAALGLSSDLLKHVSKYKTVLDPDYSKSDQDFANSILKQLNGKSKEEKFKILQSNAQKITSVAGRMGYYGNASLFNSYRNSTIGKNQNYYPNKTNKDRLQYFNETQKGGVIDQTIKNFREFREVDKNVRLKTLDIVNNKSWQEIKDRFGYDMKQSQFNLAMNELIDDNGNIVSYKTWKKKMSSIPDPENYGYTPGGTPVFGSAFKNIQEKGVKRMSALSQLYAQNDDDVTLGEYVHPAHWIWGKGNEERREDRFKEIYNNFKKSYKKSFDKVKMKEVYDGTLMDAGFGDDRNQAMEYKGVDLSVDKNMRLKSTSTPKQENVNKVFSLLFDDNGNIDKEKVTVFGDKDIKNGLNAIQRDDLDEQRENNETVLKEFLKGNNDHVTMTFFRNTNVPGQAAYQFYDTKSKKSMMVYAPKDLLGKSGVAEDLFTKTGRDPLEFSFRAKGELQLPIVYNSKNRPAYKSATLTFDREKDTYIGKTWYYDNGHLTSHEYVIPYGSAISVKAAQADYLSFLNANKNEF